MTDSTGQYQIVDLPPGTYTVTFTLTGFNTVSREGIELTGRPHRHASTSSSASARSRKR